MAKRSSKAPGATEGAAPARAALYTRVSTDDQATNGTSLAMQEERCRAYCAAKGWAVADVYCDDGYSAKGTAKRPAFQRMMAGAAAGQFGVVVIYKLDRITRSTGDLNDLIRDLAQSRVALASVSEGFDLTTAGGEAFVHLLGVFAQFERRLISERTRAAMQHKRSRLEAYGTPPFGFRKEGGKLVPDEREMSEVQRIYSMRNSGASLRAIASDLSARGVPTKRGGKRWYARIIVYILGNTVYDPHVKRCVPGRHPVRKRPPVKGEVKR